MAVEVKFYSHLVLKKILLKDHLRYVGERARAIIESKSLNGIDKNILADISYLIGISHDFGKYTTFFQEKLKHKHNNPLSHHGLISALFAFEIVNRYIREKKLCNKSPYKFLPLLAYFVVKRHHLDLGNIRSDIDSNTLETGIRNVNKQLVDIWKNKNYIEKEYDQLLNGFGFLSSEQILDSLEKYKKEIKSSDDLDNIIEELSKEVENDNLKKL